MRNRNSPLKLAATLFAALAFAGPASAQNAPTPELAAALALIETGQNEAAVVALTPLAAAGDIEAMVRLAVLLHAGTGAPRDDVRAAALFRTAADAGNAEAQHQLATLYLRGEGVERNLDEALRLLRLSAEQDYPPALLSLGFRYYNGNEGVPQDFAEAFRWFSRAAEHDMPQAQYLVGLLYSRGQGVNLDYALAFQFMWESAQAGFAGAVYAVGVAYGFGQGVERDLVQSYRWIYTAWRLTAQPPGAPIYQATFDAAMLISALQRSEAEAQALAWLAERGMQPRTQ
jgi:TPR repeat protein